MITSSMVKELRERTGCGMMDCKKALEETNGDIEKSIEFLREKGLAAAAKKAGRIAAEGIVLDFVGNNVGVIIEVNAETDFVAKNEGFQTFVKDTAKTVAELNPKSVEELLTMKYNGTNDTVLEALNEKIATIGENMNIRRFERFEGEVITYIHGEGRIGVLVCFDTDVEGNNGFKEFSKDIAMQIAAAYAQFLSVESVPAEIVAKEKEILTAQAMNEGKPANIAEKMVEGRIQKFYKEVCLLEQLFIKDTDITVKKYVENKAAELGGKIAIKSFARFEKGEGLQKKEDNFAEEVARMVQ